jgi:dual specificity MAP kinase phosphatase
VTLLSAEKDAPTQFMLFGHERQSAVPEFLFTEEKYSALEVLILDFNALTEISPHISKLTSLQKLTAAYNQLTNLPVELFSLSLLTFLRLGSNKLTKLPNAIRALTNLTELCLDTNFISSLPNGLSRLAASLRDLSLAANAFTAFPKQILKLTSLEYLDLSGCQISKLPMTISLLISLKDLSLSNVHLLRLPYQIIALTNLTSLQISMNELKTLPPNFENLQLKYLNISYNNFRKFPLSLLQMKTLCTLEAKGNIKQWKIEKFCQNITFDYNVEAPRPDLIMPGLFLGSLEAAKNRHFLKKNNVTHILSVLRGARAFYPNDFTYKIIHEDDSLSANLLQYFEETFEFIDRAREAGGGVLVHCASGISRSATIIIAYVMRKKQLTYRKAQEMVSEVRPIICPNIGFVEQLKAYEKTLFKSTCTLA